MKTIFSRLRPWHLFLIVLVLASLAYLQGAAGVPFHPDESTYLFLSTDIDRTLKNPLSLAWRPGAEDELHLLDPPLVHYAVEIGRRLGGFPPLPANWGWKLSWAENAQRGAVPPPGMLLAARLAEAGLFPFSLLFLYLATRRLANEFTAWAAVLLMASNALILLYTRRAMAEGGLIFALSLSLWALLAAEKRPWLAGIPLGLAFCAKQSLAALAVAGLLAVVWQPAFPSLPAEKSNPADKSMPAAKSMPPGRTGKAGRRVWQAALYGLLLFGTIFLLTPVAWRHPFQTIQAALRARQNSMRYATARYAAQAIETPGERAASLVDQVYFAPLMFYEDASFAGDIRAAQDAYLANPLNTLFRSPLGGGTLLGLGLLGLGAGCRAAVRGERLKKRQFSLLLAASGAQALALLAAVPLSWQRYYLPLVPFACIWAAYGVNLIKEALARRVQARQPHLA